MKDVEPAPLLPSDLAAVTAIEAGDGDVGWSQTDFAQEINPARPRFFVLKDSGNILGYGGFWKVAEEAQITNFVIASPYRRQGHGRRFLRFLLDEARRQDCSFVTLEVRRRNVAAQALYRQQGFDLQGYRPAAYTNPVDDAALMERKL